MNLLWKGGPVRDLLGLAKEPTIPGVLRLVSTSTELHLVRGFTRIRLVRCGPRLKAHGPPGERREIAMAILSKLVIRLRRSGNLDDLQMLTMRGDLRKIRAVNIRCGAT